MHSPSVPWKAGIAWALVCSVFGALTTQSAWAVDATELRSHVEYLAADELAGRATGEPGCELAAAYVAERLASWGLQPLPGQDDYRVEFTLERRTFDPERSRATLHAGGTRTYAQLGREFQPFWFSGVGSVDAEVVFAGYGIFAPELGHDDYADLDVRNTLVLVLRYEPGRDDPASPFDGAAHSQHAYFETKARVAREHGARGMLLVTGPLHGHDDADLGAPSSMTLAPSRSDDGFLSVHISQEWAAQFIAPLDLEWSDVHERVEAGMPASELHLDARVELAVVPRDDNAAIRSANVAAFLPGSDAELRDEWIVVGAHHDHIGTATSGRDRVFNGADDNASGTAVLLALAQEWAHRADAPRRSIVFVTFSGEERGLLGSRAFLEQEVVPSDKIRFMMNFDMVGRNPDRPVGVFGDGVATGVRALVEAANADIALDLAFHGRNIPRNSDHSNFYRRDIPILGFFTGMHDDYHSVRDHADKLDYGRMVEITRLGSGVLERLATMDAPEFPRFLPAGFLGIEHAQVTRTERQRLQLPPDAGVLVERVLRDSPAESAGICSGDIVVRVAGRSVGFDNIVDRLGDVGAGVEVELEILRGDALQRQRVTLARRPDGG